MLSDVPGTITDVGVVCGAEHPAKMSAAEAIAAPSAIKRLTFNFSPAQNAKNQRDS